MVTNCTQHNQVEGVAVEIDKTEPLHERIAKVPQGPLSADSLKCSIFKVPNYLREINGNAYEPRVLSIGPYYHHDKNHHHFNAMEVHKMRYLNLLLQRERKSVESYVTALKEKESEARSFYSEPLDHFKGDSFVEMMVLDGCFIIELIRKKAIKEKDPLLTDFCFRTVMRDLLLVENQLPLFVLLELSKMMMPTETDFTKFAISFFSEMMPGPQIANPGNAQDNNGGRQNKDIKHLLGLLHDNWLGSNASGSDTTPNGSSAEDARHRSSGSSDPSRSAELGTPLLGSESSDNPSAPEQDGKWKLIRSASELREAGIDFKKVSGKRLFDIDFKFKKIGFKKIGFQKGEISIPTLKIDDDTESILRNLVAYEQCYKGVSSKRFTDYITVMDCLINTGKDVELLCHCGVIDNWLGDHKVVATIFNRLRSSVLVSQEGFSYSELFIEVNKHCDNKINGWIANLNHNYLNTPWARISVAAAVILLLLTVAQTIYTVLAYYL